MLLNSERYQRHVPQQSDATDMGFEVVRKHEGATFFQLSRIAMDDNVLLPALGLLLEEKKIRTEPQGDPDKSFDDQPFRTKGWMDSVLFFTY